MKLAIPYRRVSTISQAENGHSMDNQDVEIPRWIEAHRYQCVPKDIAETLCDNGISGKKLKNRPGATRAIELACEYGRKAKRDERPVLIVYSLSRLARSTKELYDILDRLQKAGCDFASCTEPFDTTTLEGKLLFGVLAVIAEFERGLASKRTKEITAYLQENDMRWGTIPYGWMIDPSKTRTRKKGDKIEQYKSDIIENPSEQAVIALIKEWRSDGATYEAIADRLNAEHVPARSGGRWYKSSIHAICAKINGGQ